MFVFVFVLVLVSVVKFIEFTQDSVALVVNIDTVVEVSAFLFELLLTLLSAPLEPKLPKFPGIKYILLIHQ